MQQTTLWKQSEEAKKAVFKASAVEILTVLGEVHSGVTETPERYARAMQEMLSGYNQDPKQFLKVFENVQSSSMITAMGIDFCSFCEHHMLPFFGKAYIGYLPNGEGKKVLGLSKIVRILHCFTNRLQVQERIGEQFCDFIQEHLKADGVICVIHAQHMCMTRRGVKTSGTMVTSAIRGAFMEIPVRSEFLSLVNLSQKG